MAQYLLLIHDDPAKWARLSPGELENVMAHYKAWGQRLRDKNLWVAGNKLADEPGRVLRQNGNKIVITDGPYSETKEWLGGFCLIEVPNYDAAVDACNDCPHMEFGGTMEIREVDAIVAAAIAKAS